MPSQPVMMRRMKMTKPQTCKQSRERQKNSKNLRKVKGDIWIYRCLSSLTASSKAIKVLGYVLQGRRRS